MPLSKTWAINGWFPAPWTNSWTSEDHLHSMELHIGPETAAARGGEAHGLPARRSQRTNLARARTAMSEQHPLLSITELAALVGVNPATLYRTINRGEFPLPIVRLGTRMQVPRVAVERLLHGDVAPDSRVPCEAGPLPSIHCPSCRAPLTRAAGRSTTSEVRLSPRADDRHVQPHAGPLP